MDCRLHLCLDRGGLALCGRRRRSVLTPRGWLVDERCNDGTSRHRRPGNGDLATGGVGSGGGPPPRRRTLSPPPAALRKGGSHYGLPIALGLMAAIGAIPPDALAGFTVLGELGLDGSIAPVAGVLPSIWLSRCL